MEPKKKRGPPKTKVQLFESPKTEPFPPGQPPWERLPDEPDEAWEAFASYRDQDPPRQARHLTIPMAQRIQWYQKYRWGDRCAILDDHLRTVVQNEKGKFLRETVQEIGAKHMMLLSDARALAKREVEKLLESSKARELEVMKPNDLTRLVSEVVKLDRLVRGETTSNDAQTELDLSDLSTEELRQWQALAAKVKQRTPGV